MGDGGRGFRGDRRGEPGRGARIPGPAPGRGGGRGGDRKFSWKRHDGNNNSSTSNVASGSDDTSRWDEAAMGKQAAEGGIWVPKSQGSSGSAGEGTDRQISTPLRRNQGPKVNQGVMEVAWVRVSNVPLDKRSERNMAYVASLVGVPLEIDSATLHRPASARVKVGCRNVDEIPSVAEAVLGEHFYDFYFEVDQVLVRDPNRGESLLSSDWGKKEQIQESQESIESDVSLHTSLLIDSMAMEFMEEEKLVVYVDAERGESDAGKVEYVVESPDNAVEVELKAAAAVKKRNAEGTLHSHNSFDALSNQNMMLAASKMGVIIPDNDFVNIDIIRELEKFRIITLGWRERM
ncbi:hypothetical protein D1007_55286 [Hordeum vulgare]|nr:hypothetical protein D1007_55286 [Hordeum vulgare]